MDSTFPSYLWDSGEKKELSTKSKQHKRAAAITGEQEWENKK
jgi:hypothetical protein